MKKQRKKDQKNHAAKGATLYSRRLNKRKKRKKRVSKDEDTGLSKLARKINDPEYAGRVIKYLRDAGVKVDSYKERYLLRRLRVRMGRLRLTSYKDYLDYIKSYSKELKELQESLSINVTRFFRNRDTFESLKREILPQLVQKKKSIKIWSAGCAVGAEPYSLSMIASDVTPASSHVSIIATDVKDELLRIARLGLYSSPYLEEMSEIEKSRYFIQTETGDFKVKPHIKRKVQFQNHDLMKDEYPRNIDIIVCRNVLIYVDRKAQNDILNRFFESLVPGGILVLGRTETLFGDWRKSVDILSTKHRIYQKKDTSAFQKIRYDPPSKVIKTTYKQRSTLQTNTERLRELRNFRKTFEKRKKLWEERMEKSRKQRAVRRKVKSDISSTRWSKSSKKSNRPSKIQNKVPSDRELELVKKTGTLSDYRSLLKKAEVPSRISKIRRDLKD